MSKIFYCRWTDSDPKAINSYDHEERHVKTDFFTEDNGYTPEDIQRVKSLKIGEAFFCEYGNHSIQRTE